MTRFRFRLDSVLAWRKAQLEAEEFQLEQRIAARALVDRHIAHLEAARMDAERQVRSAAPVPAADLWALAAYREAARARGTALAARRAEREKEVARQREQVAAARRRCRLLERLRERRLEEWQYAEARELDALASDAYLARWKDR